MFVTWATRVCAEFTEQVVQGEDPLLVLYVDCTQGEHISPFSPVYPALHSQAVNALLPLCDIENKGHSKHVLSAEAPVVIEYLPAPHLVQVLSSEAPMVVEYFPVPQSVQTLAAEAPRVVEYLPIPQSEHSSDPIVTLNLPGTHAVHTPPSTPVYPALHWQLPKSSLPISALAFSGQLEQGALPMLLLNVPAWHKVQVCPSSPVAPTLHWQLVSSADAGGELDAVGQSWQVGLPGTDHLSAPHGWHVSSLVAP